jgi:hypothetical protein
MITLVTGDGRKANLDVEGKSSNSILEELKAIASREG